MTSTNAPGPAGADKREALRALLGGGQRSSWRRWLSLAAAVAAVVAVVAAVWFFRHKESSAPRYETAPVTQGTLVVKVSATGNLQPTNQVDVGSELSGTINAVFVDENDTVSRGQVLARLDLSKLQDAVWKSDASVVAAFAQVDQARATVDESRAQLARFERVSELSHGQVPARTEMDTARANLKRALANETNAEANVSEASATLRSDLTNLAKASIRSPISGVVLTRKAEPGQTVAATFQAPVLFTIAEDLSKMQLQVDVDEADVGQVKVGQRAAFTVDAWPGREYSAVITRVGYGSQVKEGVVSYLSILEVQNDDLSLRPGMTGTAEIETFRRDGAVLVPNAALRFTPAPPKAEEQKKSGGGRGVMGMLMPRPPRTPAKAPAENQNAAQRVWVLRDDVPTPIDVRTGATNGQVTEILSGAVRPGMQLITQALEATP